MLNIIKWLFLLIISLAIVTFAVANNSIITISLFPLPLEIDIALYLLLFACLIIGILLGGFATYLHTRKWLIETKQQQKELNALGEELSYTQQKNTKLLSE